MTQVGVVRSPFERPRPPGEMRRRESRIVVEEAFADGLDRVADLDSLLVVFYFHETAADGERGAREGVFATRSPRRPSPLGTTVVELLGVEGTELRVTGLDAVDGTPVLDLKPVYGPERPYGPHSRRSTEDP